MNHPTRSTKREANERFVHLRSVNLGTANGRTISNITAFVRTADGVEYVSFAECDSRDQFDRRAGRTVARRKWFAGKKVVLQGGYEFLNPDKAMSLYDRVFDTWSAQAPALAAAA